MARRSVCEKARFDSQLGFLSYVAMRLRVAQEHDEVHVPESLIILPSRHALPRTVRVLREDKIVGFCLLFLGKASILRHPQATR
jgi:hypothetical protein